MTYSIQLDNVSKKFQLDSPRPQSWQESMLRLFHRHTPRPEAEESFWVIQDVSFTVHPGESVALIGSNGAGKSTLLKIMAQIIRPTRGALRINGRVSAMLELGTGFHHDLTGRENIFLNGAILGLPRSLLEEQMEEIIEFSELERFIDMPVRNYSSGMYVRLGFSVAIHTDPEILIVDEVLSVGDASFQQKCMEKIMRLQRRGVTIFLVSHNLGLVENLCDRAIWLDEGGVREDGPVDEIVAHYMADFAMEQAQPDEVEEGEEEPDEAEEEVAVADEDEEAAPPVEDDEGEGEEIPSEPEETVPRKPTFEEVAAAKEVTHRWGSHEAVITRVELLDAQEMRRDLFITGEFMCVRIHYEAHEIIMRPIFGLAFYRPDGLHINGPNSLNEGFKIRFIEGKGYMDYIIESLPLNEGLYELTVAIYESDGTPLDHHDRMYFVEVEAPEELHEDGLVHISASWQHVPLIEGVKLGDKHYA